MADRSRRAAAKRRDPADWVAYGRRPGRPRVGDERVTTVLPAADTAALDEMAAQRGGSRQDMIREAVTCYLRHHHEVPRG